MILALLMVLATTVSQGTELGRGTQVGSVTAPAGGPSCTPWATCDGAAFPCIMDFEAADPDGWTETAGNWDMDFTGAGTVSGAQSAQNAGIFDVTNKKLVDAGSYVDVLWFRFFIHQADRAATGNPQCMRMGSTTATTYNDFDIVCRDSGEANGNLRFNCGSTTNFEYAPGCGTPAGENCSLEVKWKMDHTAGGDSSIWFDNDEDPDVDNFTLKTSACTGNAVAETQFLELVTGGSPHDLRYDRLCFNSADEWSGCCN